MSSSGVFPEIYKTNVLADPVPTGTFNPGAGYFSNAASSYRGGKSKRKQRQNNKSKNKSKNKTRKNRTRRNCK